MVLEGCVFRKLADDFGVKKFIKRFFSGAGLLTKNNEV